MQPSALFQDDISAIVLSAGQGLRMGGVDKGLQMFKGKPLVQHMLERLGPQVSHLMVNANRHLDLYRSFCDEVWADEEPGLGGPLAGFLVGLEKAKRPFLMTVPCDTPLIPLDLSERLYRAMSSTQADMAVVRSVDHSPKMSSQDDSPPLRAQPVLCMMRGHLAPRLRQFMTRGERKVSAWSREIHTVWVDYDQPNDEPKAFSNLNTLEDLHALE